MIGILTKRLLLILDVILSSTEFDLDNMFCSFYTYLKVAPIVCVQLSCCFCTSFCTHFLCCIFICVWVCVCAFLFFDSNFSLDNWFRTFSLYFYVLWICLFFFGKLSIVAQKTLKIDVVSGFPLDRCVQMSVAQEKKNG